MQQADAQIGEDFLAQLVIHLQRGFQSGFRRAPAGSAANSISCCSAGPSITGYTT